MRMIKIIVGIGFMLAGASIARADEGSDFFEKQIRPVMVERCYECHSAGAKKVKGKFKLDTKEDFEKGGETGAPVVKGGREKSLLIKAIRYKDEDLAMPPKEKLPDQQIADFEKWVKMGAPYPPGAAKKVEAKVGGDPLAEAKKFCSFVPPKKVVPPMAGGAWAKTEIDRFIAAK